VRYYQNEGTSSRKVLVIFIRFYSNMSSRQIFKKCSNVKIH